jgi:probable HAF family extracellular repeat protein
MKDAKEDDMKPIRRLLPLGLLALLSMPVLLIAQGQNSKLHYKITDLGPVGGPPGQPYVITTNGIISEGVGVSDTVWHAMLWFHGVQMDLAKGGGLGGPSSVAFGVNDMGQAVGQAETADPDHYGEDFCGFGTRRVCQPFVWKNGVMAPLPPLTDANGIGGRNASAITINLRGQIGGTAENTVRDSTCPPVDPALLQFQQFQFKPVLWEKGKIRELPTYGGDPDGVVFDINDSGQAVGASGTCMALDIKASFTYLNQLHATLWQDGGVHDLGNLGGVGPNIAITINKWGQVVGASGTPDGLFHGFFWRKETGIEDLGALQHDGSQDIASVALAINDHGEIVGISFLPDFTTVAFLKPAGGIMVDLNSLVPDSQGLLFDARFINSRGEIAGLFLNAAGEAHGYLAIPDNNFDPWADSGAARASQLEYARKLLRERLSSGRFGVRAFLRR